MTLKTFTHNGYNGGRRTTDSFRIGYSAYRVWTLAGFYLDELRERAEHNLAEVSRVEAGLAHAVSIQMWNLPPWLASMETYIAEMTKRSSALRGASPQGAVLTADRADAKRRSDAFHALPEVAWGEHVLIDGTEYVVTRDNNDHVRFVPPVSDDTDEPST